MPCGSDRSFIFQVCPQRDKIASRLPMDRECWTKAFPRLGREIELMLKCEGMQHHFTLVRCPRWHRGRVAIIGDAAHALPPTLGQGAGLTLMNAQALVMMLRRGGSVEETLRAWEASVRPVSDTTQRWAMRYDFLACRWPESLALVRAAIIRAFQLPALNQRMRIADRGLGGH
jgi:2-polyprenyl-6-methoxyphenol hydroxylase-like FAD-dependent oxidoreductase